MSNQHDQETLLSADYSGYGADGEEGAEEGRERGRRRQRIKITSSREDFSQLRETLLEYVDGDSRRSLRHRLDSRVSDGFIESTENVPHYAKQDTSEDLLA